MDRRYRRSLIFNPVRWTIFRCAFKNSKLAPNLSMIQLSRGPILLLYHTIECEEPVDDRMGTTKEVVASKRKIPTRLGWLNVQVLSARMF
jgi:hypothetical protein